MVYKSFSHVSYKPPGMLRGKQPRHYRPHFADENTEEQYTFPH